MQRTCTCAALVVALAACAPAGALAAESKLAAESNTTPPNATLNCDVASSSMTGSATIDAVLSASLLLFSALFSGLTLGLMSLDVSGLELKIRSGTDNEKKWASRIKPVREDGNFLLCTLLLGNTLVNALIAILSASFTSGLVGALVSTGFIVIFGEIMPQSACARYGLVIGSSTVNIVRLFMLLLFPVAKPIALVLDCVLGEELRTIFDKEELLALLKMQVEQDASELNTDDQKILEGTLRFANQRVCDIMTRRYKAEDGKNEKATGIFMVAEDEKLDFEQMLLMYKKGHTRIPVCRGRPDNPNAPIVGLMLTKDLIMLDPDDDVPVSALLEFCGREIRVVPETTTLQEMLTTFLGKGTVMNYYRERSHLFFVVPADKFTEELKTGSRHRSRHGHEEEAKARLSMQLSKPGVEVPGYENLEAPVASHVQHEERQQPLHDVIGLVTLEDILEEILQAEIVDETDEYIDNTHGATVRKNKRDQIREQNRETFFREMCMKNVHARQLGDQEIRAVTSFLYNNVKPFESKKSVITQERLEAMVRCSELRTIMPQENSGDALYRRGTVYDHCCLILSGKLRIRAGEEAFESECGPFTILAAPSLAKAGHEVFTADFTAQVYDKARVLILTRTMYRDLLVGAQLRSPIARVLPSGGERWIPDSPDRKSGHRKKRHSAPDVPALSLDMNADIETGDGRNSGPASCLPRSMSTMTTPSKSPLVVEVGGLAAPSSAPPHGRGQSKSARRAPALPAKSKTSARGPLMAGSGAPPESDSSFP